MDKISDSVDKIDGCEAKIDGCEASYEPPEADAAAGVSTQTAFLSTDFCAWTGSKLLLHLNFLSDGVHVST